MSTLQVTNVKYIRGRHPYMAEKTAAAEAAETAYAAKAAGEKTAADAVEKAAADAEAAELADSLASGAKKVSQETFLSY